MERGYGVMADPHNGPPNTAGWLIARSRGEHGSGITHYDTSDGPRIVEIGEPHLKKPNPVYLVHQASAFSVQTNEGLLTGQPGDYLAHDPISGHVWPVAASYVTQHYEPAHFPANAQRWVPVG